MAQSAEDRRAANTAVKRRSREAVKEAAQAARPKLVDADNPVDWIEGNLHLPAQSSYRPGRFRPVWPHQRAWVSLPFLEDGPRIMTVQKCARAGFTKCLVAISAYGVLKGKNVLLLQPRQKDAISFRDDALEPSLSVFGKEAHWGLPWSKTELHLRPMAYSPVQTIKILHGVSPDLRRVQASIAGADELDAFPHDVGGDGGLFERLDSRLRESKGKLIAGSTPTRRGSLLDLAMANADLTFTWSFSCPSCETWQELDFDRLSDEGLACVDCGEVHPEKVIRRAAQRWQAPDGRYIGDDGQTLYPDGEWPESLYHIGFRIGALSIPALDWPGLRRAKKRAKSPEQFKVFMTECIGKSWGASGRVIAVGDLMDQRQDLASDPARLRLATADVQRDRIEVCLTEWDAEERAYVMEYAVLQGDTDIPGKGAWLALGAQVNQWRVHGGLVDSGYRGEGAYEFCRGRYGWRAIRGLANPPAAGGLYQVTRQRDKNADLVGGAVSQVKMILYDRLADDRQRWFHYNRSLQEPFFQGFLAEELRVERGKDRWVKLGPNEPLDCMVYAFISMRFMKERMHWRAGSGFPQGVPRRGVLRTIG